MAMNSATLKTEIEALLGSKFTKDNEHCVISELIDAISQAVVTHITTNAEVGSSGAHSHPNGSHPHPAGNIS